MNFVYIGRGICATVFFFFLHGKMNVAHDVTSVEDERQVSMIVGSP